MEHNMVSKSKAWPALRNQLFDAFLTLETREEVEAFLADLCTPSEIRAFVERWHVAQLLEEEQAGAQKLDV